MVLEEALLEDYETGRDDFDVVDSRDALFRRPLIEATEVLGTLNGAEVFLADVASGLHSGTSIPGPYALELLQAYLRDHRLAAALNCCDQAQDEDSGALRQARLEQALVKTVFDVTPEAVDDFLELHRQVLVHEPSYVLDLAVFPWNDDSQAATLDRFREIMDLLADGNAPPKEIWAADADIFLGITMTETQAIAYDPDLASALRSMPPDIYSLPASSDRAGGFLMVKLHERNSDQTLSPDTPSDREEIAQAYLRIEGDRAVSRVLASLKSTVWAKRGAIEDLVAATREDLP